MTMYMTPDGNIVKVTEWEDCYYGCEYASYYIPVHMLAKNVSSFSSEKFDIPEEWDFTLESLDDPENHQKAWWIDLTDHSSYTFHFTQTVPQRRWDSAIVGVVLLPDDLTDEERWELEEEVSCWANGWGYEIGYEEDYVEGPYWAMSPEDALKKAGFDGGIEIEQTINFDTINGE